MTLAGAGAPRWIGARAGGVGGVGGVGAPAAVAPVEWGGGRHLLHLLHLIHLLHLLHLLGRDQDLGIQSQFGKLKRDLQRTLGNSVLEDARDSKDRKIS